ncbi:MAG: YicC family protein [Bacteroidales bacterium]|nr:YicC family protein [Candidatus Colicola faecequi]
MLLSMTGYGKAEYTFSDHKTIVEIRSLNSKQLDMTLKTALVFREKEAELRAILTKALERGKVDATIYTQPLEATASADFTPINWEAVKYYVDDYNAHLDLGLPVGTHQSRIPNEVMAGILRFPDVMKQTATADSLSDEEWALLQQAVGQAIDAFVAFRKQEGASLQAMFTEKLDGIAALLAEVEPFEKGRVEHIKEHLLDNLDKLAEKTKQAVDRNRLEQEMIYYLEKLDITEEKVRLTNHIKYFRETMQETGAGVGKKLGFVAQEMGREINTLGSKSNQSEMQIIVVKMKDILEQIKEQVLNVL